MKILIVSQHFWPETFRINDLALELKRKGYDVEVLTGKPNYPGGKYYKGYSFWQHNQDTHHGIKIYRVPLIRRGNGSVFRLSLNYLSFIFFASIFLIFQRKKYDYTITFASSPILQAIPPIIHRKLYKSKALVWVQDLWPESVVAIYNIKKGLFYSFLRKIVEFIYANSDKIMIQSEAFEDAVMSHCKSKSKLIYLPNWAEEIFEIEHLKSQTDNFKFPDGFKVMFAGNIGEAQDFDSIIKAAELTKKFKQIKWVVIGDGRKKKKCELLVNQLGLEDTVFFLGKHPLEKMPSMFSKADIMLITLKDKEIFSLTIPSKIQSYMAFGKPIIGMLNGISSRIIQEAKCGYSVAAGDYKALAEKVILAYNTESAELQSYGDNARRYYFNNFSKEHVIEVLENVLKDTK